MSDHARLREDEREALAERLMADRMAHYGYTPDALAALCAEADLDRERGGYHRRAGCELNEGGWDCTDEWDKSRHPQIDELEDTAEWIIWFLDHPLLAARAAQTDAGAALSSLARAKQTADWDDAQGPATSYSPDDRTVPALLAGILDALIACAEVRAALTSKPQPPESSST